MKLLTRTFVTVLVILAGLLPAACGQQRAGRPPDQVSVQLKWLHQAQFAGFYAADQRGYYAQEGLAVSFIEGGPGVDVFAPVLQGTAQFGVAAGDELIVARAEGYPVRAIAAIYRRSPVVFISLADSAVTRPHDFPGKTIRVSADLVPSLHAMTNRVGVSPDQYHEVILPSDVAAFASGEVPVWEAYLDGLAEAVRQAGYEINVIYPDDYGVHFYGDILFATDDVLSEDPDLAVRFLRATVRGWTYAVENPGEVGRFVAHYEPAADAALENRRMLVILPLVHTGDNHIGWMRGERWAGIHDVLLEQGVLDAPVDVSQVYTMEFLQQVYGSD